MGTETFTAFDSSGSAWKLKGRILRHLSNDPVTEADKSNIRSTLGITSQGGLGDLLAANNLDDVSNAATSRTNLDVNSIAQDSEANGTKLVGPSMHFDGTSYIEFAANPALTPTTGSGATRQDTAFSFGTWLKLNDDYELSIGQYGTSAANRGWLLYMDSSSSPKFKFAMEDGSANEMRVTSSDDYFVAGKWTHIAVTCTALSAASARQDDIKIYVNGKEISTTNFNVGYTGLTYSATQPLLIGKRSSTLSAFSQRDFKFFNKALSASEVKTLCLSGQLPNSFSESTGGADGGIYTQDATPSGEFVAVNTVLGDHVGPLGGKSDVLSITVSGTSSSAKQANLTIAGVAGKRIRVKGFVYVPSTNSNADGFILYEGGVATYVNLTAPTQDAWVPFEGEAIYDGGALRFAMQDGGTTNFADAGGDDVIYIAETTVTQIGSVLDARAENYNQSANKLLDVTANNFVGTGSGVTIINPRTHISAETLDLTNLPASDSGLSAGEVYNDSGTLKIKL